MPRKLHVLLVGNSEYENAASLEGPKNDVSAMERVLAARFAAEFEEVDFRILRDATREEILAGLDDLAQAAGDEGAVLFYYSGHGSETEVEGQRHQSIVPRESGRGRDGAGRDLNRDIYDREIAVRVRRFATPHLLLIFDCCHSGTVFRDDEAVRQVPPDRTPSAEVIERIRAADRQLTEQEGPFTLAGANAVALSACRDGELSQEFPFDREDSPIATDASSIRFGALTFFLVDALQDAHGRMTWNDMFLRVAMKVRSRTGRKQTPRLEGAGDRAVLGLERLRWTPSLRVLAVEEGGRLTLSGGAAHGVGPGSAWRVRSASARHRTAGRSRTQGIAHVEEVGGWTSRARLEGEGAQPGQRAFLERLPSAGGELEVTLAGDVAAGRKELAAAVEEAPWLRLSSGESHDVAIRRGTSDREPGGTVWVAQDRAGVVALEAGVGPDAGERGLDDVSVLVGDLEKLARYRALRGSSGPADGPLVGRVALRVGRFPAGEPFREAEPEAGAVVFRSGEHAELLIVHQHPAEIRVFLVAFDGDGSIELQVPNRAHSSGSRGGVRLGVEEVLRLPEGFWGDAFKGRGYEQSVPEGRSSRRYALRLFATAGKADFWFFEQGPIASLVRPIHELDLGGAGGNAPVPVAGEAWAVAEAELEVRRG